MLLQKIRLEFICFSKAQTIRKLIKKKAIGTYLKQIMPKISEKEKVFNILEKEVNVISAVNNAKLAPYLDIFEHYPENILLQPLGILTGFFRINDFSEESAYIVNFLSSLLKKEYYANPKRSIDNSFDSALRKVNLALSEIAKEGNINWLGRIEGAVCVLEKNNLHFSVCGNSKILLIRNQIITEVSKDLSSEEKEPNPLKTFANVSSGRLDNGDKIIVCSEDIFDIFSLNEIKKGSVRFQKEKFVQFVKTALTNKLELIGTIIIDLFEKNEEKSAAQKKNIEALNAFSEKTFEKNTPKINNLKEILEKEDKNEYTDEKTGHIYIQEEQNGEMEKEGSYAGYWIVAKEKLFDFYCWFKNKSRKELLSIGKSITKARKEIAAKIKKRQEEKRIEKAELEKKQAEITEKNPATSEISTQKETFFKLISQEPERKKEAKKNISFAKFTPGIGKIKTIFSSLSGKQKLYTVAAIAIIFIFPLVFIKIQNSIKNKSVSEQIQEKVPDEREILSKEKNITFLKLLTSITKLGDAKNATILNEKLLIATPDKIISWARNEEVKNYLLPENSGKILAMTAMEDLNLVLILTDQKKIISWSPASPVFKDNQIEFPENSDIKSMAAYMTYLYVADKNSGKIYRYPRAEGGFGIRTEWSKENINLSDGTSMAIDENIYLNDGEQVIKLFKGNVQPFMIEQSAKNFNVDKIITGNKMNSIYLADKAQGRIFEYSKDGSLIRQYYHEDLKGSVDFAIDESNQSVYIILHDGSISFFTFN